MYVLYEGSASGLVGTVAVMVLREDGTTYAARTTAGITEPLAGSAVYALADPDPSLTLTFLWDEVAGGICASETLYAGRGSVPDLSKLDAAVSSRLAAADYTDVDLSGVLAAIAALPDDTDIAALDALLDAIKARTDTLGGAGAIEWSYTLTAVGGVPIADADVWVTTDAVGANVIASGRTDTSGVATFYLDAGTVYVWAQKAGWNFANPDVEVIA